MKVFMITYDLRAPGRNYESLYEAIRSAGAWWHFLESSWLLATNESSIQVWNRLASNIDRNDHLLIIEVRRDAYGWLPQEAWDWINANVPL
jgi:hypothetical protein